MVELGGRIWIRQAEPRDSRILLANMREKDIAECRAAGMSPGRALRTSLRGSLFAKTVLLDGTVIAMIGLCGRVISDHGVPWMLTGKGIETVPLSFAKVARRETDDMLNYKMVLSNYVWADYHEAIRFFKLIGFEVFPPEPVGKNGAMFCKIVKGGL
jgi:uncharacterized protein Usg